ncbi:MAG: AraC family ligand binding domain-containing protein, partial [Clostridia bacterium]|nr:AraC family ligand binding domain-containing protein [Clostridia bacterium]
MEKSDMIEIDGVKLEFAYMGYFVGEKDWIHPQFTLDTYEIIFVTSGTVYIQEDEKYYTLYKGDAIILRPGVMHKGYKSSDDTSFFWFHFYSNNFDGFSENLFHASDYYNYELLFRRLNHLATIGANKSIIECEIALMLLNRKYSPTQNNKLFFEVADYIKVHIANGLTVSSVAQKFGYNPDYL